VPQSQLYQQQQQQRQQQQQQQTALVFKFAHIIALAMTGLSRSRIIVMMT